MIKDVYGFDPKRMDKQKLTDWVKALESGGYQQTTGGLYNNGKYCCIGVLSEVCSIDPEYSDDAYVIAEEVSGFSYNGGDNSDFFWIMNDREKKTFTEIAQVIRKELLGEIK